MCTKSEHIKPGVEVIERIDTFVRRLAKIGVDVKVAGNFPWIYLTHINGKKVDELLLGNHGFTIAFYPMRHNEALKFTDIGKIFELIRRYTGNVSDDDAQFLCSIETRKIPMSNMTETILRIEAGDINTDEFRKDLMTLLQKHCK